MKKYPFIKKKKSIILYLRERNLLIEEKGKKQKIEYE